MDPTSSQHHRDLAKEASASIWELLDLDALTPAEQEDLLGRVYAAAHHHRRSTPSRPRDTAHSAYLIARAWLVLGNLDLASHYGDLVLEICSDHGLDDIDLAYAHELLARILRAQGRHTEAEQSLARARATTIANPAHREMLEVGIANW